MTRDAGPVDPTTATLHEFADFVEGATDQDIEAAIRAAGTGPVLDRMFRWMEESFLPKKAKGVDARIQWVVKDAGEEHAYVVDIGDGACTARRDRIDHPRSGLTLDLAPFVKLVMGLAEGAPLFFAGKLKIAGDVMFSQRIPSFFDRPKAK